MMMKAQRTSKLSEAMGSLVLIIICIDQTFNVAIQPYYYHLRTVREMTISSRKDVDNYKLIAFKPPSRSLSAKGSVSHVTP
jgi:hypothetical protein